MKRALACLLLAASAFAGQWLAKPVDDRTFKTYLGFFAYDRQLPLELKILDVSEQDGVAREHLSFQSTPGVRVFAYFYRPVAALKRTPAVILLHGGGAVGKAGATTQAFGLTLARLGWGVLAIDLQYFGERSTDLLSTYTEQEKGDRLYNQPSVYLAWVGQTVKDVGRALDLLAAERNADPGRIALLGSSRGAVLGTIAAAAERRLAAVVLSYGGHMTAWEKGHLPAACPANYIGRISPRPLLMLNGTQDATFPRDTAVLPLHKLAKNPQQTLWFDTGHAAPNEEQRASIVKWLRESLK